MSEAQSGGTEFGSNYPHTPFKLNMNNRTVYIQCSNKFLA
jgi:hypothetical protein